MFPLGHITTPRMPKNYAVSHLYSVILQSKNSAVVLSFLQSIDISFREISKNPIHPIREK